MASEWKIKAFGGRCVCSIYTRRLRPTTTDRKLSEGRWTDETSGRRCSRQARINNNTTHTHTHTTPRRLHSVFPSAREHPPLFFSFFPPFFLFFFCITGYERSFAVLHRSFMAAALTMSGGGQEDPFYPLQKATLPAGFPLEDSALFGLDCKITDKAGQNDYTQVNKSNRLYILVVMRFIEWAWQIGCCRSRLLFFPLATKFKSATRGDVNQHFVFVFLLLLLFAVLSEQAAASWT